MNVTFILRFRFSFYYFNISQLLSLNSCFSKGIFSLIISKLLVSRFFSCLIFVNYLSTFLNWLLLILFIILMFLMYLLTKLFFDSGFDIITIIEVIILHFRRFAHTYPQAFRNWFSKFNYVHKVSYFSF